MHLASVRHSPNYSCKTFPTGVCFLILKVLCDVTVLPTVCPTVIRYMLLLINLLKVAGEAYQT
jgi:hypothetical protein